MCASNDTVFPGRSLIALLFQVSVPSDCLPRRSRNDLELMPGFLNDLGEERPEVGSKYATNCIYEDTVYNDGDQWTATHEACKMCFCQRFDSCELRSIRLIISLA